jgi:CelD/BcsL family acetyltransferase involved in cellulose biosynthesis
MTQVYEINDIEELDSYRLLWNSWLPQTPRATFFNTWDWLVTYWRHFGHDQELRVLVVRSAGTDIGMLPLCVRRERHGFGPMRVLGYPLDDWGPWYGPIGSNRAATMLAAMQYLRDADRDWDAIDLRWNGPPASDGGRARRSMQVAGLLSDEQPYQNMSIVELEGGWGKYLAGRSRKVRHEIRRVMRRTFDDRKVEFIRHRPGPAREGDGDPRWDLFEMCQQVAQASWQATSTNGNTLTHERVRDFLRDAHEVAANKGMLDVNLLVVDDQPAAFAYNYHYDGRVTGLRMGFDPRIGPSGLGTALLLRAIEDSAQRGDATYDLGPGDSRFKRHFRTRSESSYRLRYLPIGSWRSQAVRLAGWARRRLRRPTEEVGKPASA